MAEVYKIPLDSDNSPPYQDVPITQEPKSAETTPLHPDPQLEYFTSIDEFVLTRRLKLIETLFGCRMNNKFAIKVGSVHLYHAAEKSPCCLRCCCGPLRSFDLNIMDYRDNRVLNIQRGCVKGCFCYMCSASGHDFINVFTGNGTKLGSVKKISYFWKPSYVITNANDEVILTLKGPKMVFTLCDDVIFQLITNSGDVVGEVRKIWDGCCRAIYVNLDKFSVKFSANLSIEMKALALASLFLIDVIHFDSICNLELTETGVP